jgi:hypothetical protein
MNFPIKPYDILSLTEDSVAALAASPSAVRRAYVCVIMAAHLAEHVAAAKGYDASHYRDGIEQDEPALKLLRDLGNYAKHVHISRYSPEATSLAVSGATSFYSLADTLEYDDDDDDNVSEDITAEGFYVQDGSSQIHSLLTIMKSVIFFWREELLRLELSS